MCQDLLAPHGLTIYCVEVISSDSVCHLCNVRLYIYCIHVLIQNPVYLCSFHAIRMTQSDATNIPTSQVVVY